MSKLSTFLKKKIFFLILCVSAIAISMMLFRSCINTTHLNDEYHSVKKARYPNEKEANTALARNPTDVKALRTLADSALEHHDRSKSEKLYRKCLSIRPNDFITKYMFGISLIGTEKHQEGITLIEDVSKSGDSHYKDQSNYILSKFR